MANPELPLSNDGWNILFVPLLFLTARDAITRRSELFDNNLTEEDRALLQRVAIFIVLPIIVLIHELGHAAAGLMVGGKIIDFHYGLQFGYVDVLGRFSPAQSLWIALSGNLVQIILGYIFLAVALLVKSPPKVALLTYCGVMSIGDTAVLYALMSAAGVYGDWKNIYTCGDPNLVAVVAFFHVVVVLSLIWGFTAAGPRLWYVSATNPQWAEAFRELKTRRDKLTKGGKTGQSSSSDNELQLMAEEAILYIKGGLLKEAGKTVRQAEKQFPQDNYLRFLEGEVLRCGRSPENGLRIWQDYLSNQTLSIADRLELCLNAIGAELGRGNVANAELLFKQIEAHNEDLGDIKFYKARLFSSIGKYEEALKLLDELKRENTRWLDSGLLDDLPLEYSRVRNAILNSKRSPPQRSQ